MEYQGKVFYTIVATPGCGKSFLCDKYPDKFVDVDEVRLRCKYIVPENITRAELERTKGDRPFPKRAHYNEYIKDLYDKLDEYVMQGKTLILAPHPEAIDYLVNNNIKFAFVFQGKDMKNEQIERMRRRGNSEELIKQNSEMFDKFYEMNIKENKSVVYYEFGKDEFLEDIVKNLVINFNPSDSHIYFRVRIG